MKVIKYYCDSCGEEIAGDDVKYELFYKKQEPEVMTSYNGYSLCKSCTNVIFEKLGGKPKN